MYTSGTHAQDHTQHTEITNICNTCICLAIAAAIVFSYCLSPTAYFYSYRHWSEKAWVYETWSRDVVVSTKVLF